MYEYIIIYEKISSIEELSKKRGMNDAKARSKRHTMKMQMRP